MIRSFEEFARLELLDVVRRSDLAWETPVHVIGQQCQDALDIASPESGVGLSNDWVGVL